ncbi:hypothetical protein R6Z07F_000356 [Ovis aries]|uniref:START domain-containing protein n=1 Tax=Ovis aries TaxID=9940 RepID=A0A836AD82_SHEEP|nr:hypothetical protein JEQ12_000372 [Ovis aries]
MVGEENMGVVRGSSILGGTAVLELMLQEWGYSLKYIVSCKQAEMPLSVPWDPSNQVCLSYNRVSSLKMLVAKDNWVLSSESNQVRLYTLEEDKFLSFHMEMLVHVDTAQAFLLLSDLRRRPEWDKHCWQQGCRPPGHTPTQCPLTAPTPSSWVWLPGLQVSYYNQATPGVLKYVTTNVTGLSSEFYTTFKACEQFLLDNRNDLAPSLQTL